MKVPLIPKSIYFQLNNRQLPPLSDLNSLIFFLSLNFLLNWSLQSKTSLSSTLQSFRLTHYKLKKQSLEFFLAWMDINQHHIIQVPITENQLGTIQIIEEVTEHVGSNYTEIPHSRFVVHPVSDFLFSWEEAWSAKNHITIDEDEGFSEI